MFSSNLPPLGVSNQSFSGICFKIPQDQQAILDSIPEWSTSPAVPSTTVNKEDTRPKYKSSPSVGEVNFSLSKSSSNNCFKEIVQTSSNKISSFLAVNNTEFTQLRAKSVSLSSLVELSQKPCLRSTKSVSEICFTKMSGNVVSKTVNSNNAMNCNDDSSQSFQNNQSSVLLPKKRSFGQLPDHILNHKFITGFDDIDNCLSPTSKSKSKIAVSSKTNDDCESQQAKRMKLLDQRLAPNSTKENQVVDSSKTIFPLAVNPAQKSKLLQAHSSKPNNQSEILNKDLEPEKSFAVSTMVAKAALVPEVIFPEKFNLKEQHSSSNVTIESQPIPCGQPILSSQNSTQEEPLKVTANVSVQTMTQSEAIGGLQSSQAGAKKTTECSVVTETLGNPVAKESSERSQLSGIQAALQQPYQTMKQPTSMNVQGTSSKVTGNSGKASLNEKDSVKSHVKSSKRKRKTTSSAKNSNSKNAKTVTVQFSPEQFNSMVELIKKFVS